MAVRTFELDRQENITLGNKEIDQVNHFKYQLGQHYNKWLEILQRKSEVE